MYDYAKMLYVQRKRRNDGSYPFSLLESGNILGIVFTLFGIEWVLPSLVKNDLLS